MQVAITNKSLSDIVFQNKNLLLHHRIVQINVLGWQVASLKVIQRLHFFLLLAPSYPRAQTPLHLVSLEKGIRGGTTVFKLLNLEVTLISSPHIPLEENTRPHVCMREPENVVHGCAATMEGGTNNNG